MVTTLSQMHITVELNARRQADDAQFKRWGEGQIAQIGQVDEHWSTADSFNFYTIKSRSATAELF
jgi:hypothetical protein